LSFLHNYFDGLTKLFSDLYLAKFLDISAKSFFPCTHSYFFVRKYGSRILRDLIVKLCLAEDVRVFSRDKAKPARYLLRESFFPWCRLRGIDRSVTNGRVWCLAIRSRPMDSWSLGMTVRSYNVPCLVLLARLCASLTSIKYRSLRSLHVIRRIRRLARLSWNTSFKSTMKSKNSMQQKKKY